MRQQHVLGSPGLTRPWAHTIHFHGWAESATTNGTVILVAWDGMVQLQILTECTVHERGNRWNKIIMAYMVGSIYDRQPKRKGRKGFYYSRSGRLLWKSVKSVVTVAVDSGATSNEGRGGNCKPASPISLHTVP